MVKYEIIPEVRDPRKVMTIKIEPLYCTNKIKKLITTKRNILYIEEHIKRGTLYATSCDITRTGASYYTIRFDERVGIIVNIDFENETIQIAKVGRLLDECKEDELIAIPRALYKFDDSDPQEIKDILFITFDIELRSIYYNKYGGNDDNTNINICNQVLPKICHS